jgi:ABC-2 type transport system permease protein
MKPVRALLAKEFLDLRRNRGALIPVAMITVLSLALPFAVTIGIPVATGLPLGDDPGLQRLSAVVGFQDELSPNGRIELFLFQQFLMLFLLTPITGAMSLAAHAVIGEKQTRTLEPLLATPVTTFELLLAKVLGALLPTLAISMAGLALYFGGIAAFGDPGVFDAMMSGRSAILIFVLGPAAALVSLQGALVISSRVNDARTAQQFAVLLIMPLAVGIIGQFVGRIWLSVSLLAFVGLGLFGVWLLLTLLSVALFDRESILTRWR